MQMSISALFKGQTERKGAKWYKEVRYRTEIQLTKSNQNKGPKGQKEGIKLRESNVNVDKSFSIVGVRLCNLYRVYFNCC